MFRDCKQILVIPDLLQQKVSVKACTGVLLLSWAGQPPSIGCTVQAEQLHAQASWSKGAPPCRHQRARA